MKILVFAEQKEGTIRKSSCEATHAARTLADQLGGECIVLVAGPVADTVAASLGAYGAARVIVAESPVFERFSAPAVAREIAGCARTEGAGMVFLAASAAGKDLAPRVAVQLEAGLAADCTEIRVEKGDVVFGRPVFAGKALADVHIATSVKVASLRPNVFAAPAGTETAPVTRRPAQVTAADANAVVTSTTVAAGRPDVTEADIVVSGGRGLKGAEHFALIEALADAVGGAVGASRAVVDAGWRPHGEQVGQTGKTVSPSLYIACGISGAVQHLAGMSSSRCIVAINKDKDAPIFQIADYGIVGDVFDILPELTAQLKAARGR
jgi:electron transfer flavoprotein alpha subunit